MTYSADKVKENIPLSSYLSDNGIEVRNGRCRAEWRDGQGWNVSINDGKGFWKDFVTGQKGSIIDLAMRVEGFTDIKTTINRLGERYGIEKMDRHTTGPRPNYKHPSKPVEPSHFTGRVRELLAVGGGKAAPADLMDLSPFPIPTDPIEQTVAWFNAVYPFGDELVFVTRKGGDYGVPRQTIRMVTEWVQMACCGDVLRGDIATPNPISDEGLSRLLQVRSGVKKEDIESPPPFAVLEFDEMPNGVEEQSAFWRGFIKNHPLRVQLVSLVYSGGRSIHGLIAMRSRNMDEWQHNADILKHEFCNDPDERYRADAQAIAPLVKTRIAGVCRLGTGIRQTLLYLNPNAGWMLNP